MILANKRAIITGASKGVGFALAKKLADLGCSLTLIARNEDSLKQNLNQLSIKDANQKHSYISCDLAKLLTDEESAKKPILDCIDGLSILINCAGLTNHTLLSRIKDDTIISTINLNLIVPILLTRLSTKPMLKQAARQKEDEIKPQILNISSVLSLTNTLMPGTSVYSASKSGLLGFTNALAYELKNKVKINSILPGLIFETEMGANANLKGEELHAIPLDTVINEAVKIILDNSINGQNIIVDGRGTKPFQIYKGQY